MNAIKLKELVDLYLDVTRNARYPFADYNRAVPEATEKFLDDMFGDLNLKKVYGFQRFQQLRDNLYTLIKVSNPTITVESTVTNRYGESFIINHINFPADYRELGCIQTLLGGFTDYAKPTDYNSIGPLLNDSFAKPSNTQMYYNDDATGYKIYRGSTGTLTQITLTYIKEPNEFSIGNESLLISAGAGVLTNATSYIAVETSVHNGITYLPGTQFTTANTNLTSGQVILSANTVPCELPEKAQNDIAKIAAAILSGVVSDYNRSAFVDKEASGA
jgi:hypothetical protein